MLCTPTLENMFKKEIFDNEIVSIERNVDIIKTEYDDNAQMDKNIGAYRKTPKNDVRIDGLPRTPTPFKNALAELGRRRSEM
jgi:hypothetical protein